MAVKRSSSVMVLLALFMTGCADTSAPIDAEPVAGMCTRYDSFSGQTLVGNPDPAATGGLILGEPGQELGSPLEPPILDAVSTAETDRVQFELVGDGFIGWSVRFVQDPRLRATDEIVPIAGKCVLQVDLSGVEVSGDRIGKLSPETIAGVVEVLSFPSGEAITQTFVGTRAPDPHVDVDVAQLPDRTAIVLFVT